MRAFVVLLSTLVFWLPTPTAVAQTPQVDPLTTLQNEKAKLPPEQQPVFDALGVAFKAKSDQDAAEKEKVETEKKQVQKEKEEADAEKDEEVSSKLLERGIVLGAGAVLQIHLRSTDSSHFDLQPQAKLLAMPYVAIMPGYLKTGASQRKYCASRFTGTELEAQRAADNVAREQAEEFAAHFLGIYQLGTDLAALKAAVQRTMDLGSDQLIRADAIVNAVVAYRNVGKEDKESAQYHNLVSLISAEENLVNWTIGIPASCWPHKFGIYVGRPINSDFVARYRGNEIGEFSVSSVVSVGLAIVPSAYVSFMVGYTYGTANPSTTVEGEEVKSAINVHQLSLGIGGNADLIGALLN